VLGEVAVLKVQEVWKPVGRVVAVVVGVKVRGRGKSSFVGECMSMV